MGWELASVEPESLVALSVGDDLIVRGVVTAPSPGYEVRIESVPDAPGRPRFRVLTQAKSGTWPDTISRLPVIGVVAAGGEPEEIVIETASGEAVVPVRVIETEPLGGNDPKPVKKQSATGYSASASFQEAFDNAIGALPQTGGDAQALHRIRVVDSGIIVGGDIDVPVFFVAVERVAMREFAY
jgi:hypothetical protein